nr:phosphopantothenoylcysteine decarboxylase subunit VHS3-like [Physcomitrium patens]|eukprot:XP_024369575.1 phosphopantothenoylcysteine decarboxylase subunit VHS3-like [Physcomitrella patens]
MVKEGRGRLRECGNSVPENVPAHFPYFSARGMMSVAALSHALPLNENLKDDENDEDDEKQNKDDDDQDEDDEDQDENDDDQDKNDDDQDKNDDDQNKNDDDQDKNDDDQDKNDDDQDKNDDDHEDDLPRWSSRLCSHNMNKKH